MNIAILCLGAVLATVVAWMYLNVQKPTSYDEDETEGAEETPAEIPEETIDESSDESSEEGETPATSDAEGPKLGLFAKPTLRRGLFLALMALSLCGMAAVLECVFPSNTLLENGKLISLLAILFVAANTDARYRIIPNALVLTGLVLRIVFWIMELISSPDAFWGIMKSDLLACLLVVAFVVVGVLLVKGGLGMGDVKLMLVMCLFQGFYGVISSLFFSLLAAFIYSIIALLCKKKTKKDSVAFGPAILLGTMVSVFMTGM